MKDKKGLCTGYIDRIYRKNFLMASSQEPCFIKCVLKDSLFKLPIDTTTPIVMVAAGCGVSPFIGYIEEREWLAKTQKGKYGPLELYFGCRRKAADFIYGEKVTRWKHEGLLSGLHLAFSRDQTAKVYVQGLLKGNKKQLYELIKEKGAIVAVCGSLNVGQEVYNAILDVLSEDANPKALLADMEKNGRYVAEVWN